ncbi:hypothetical protein DA2_2687 [Desulfovibrio sp. A2]|nr:hypothetical protein DA2_2687 [Desulfovibrio sp. A2]
MAARVRALHVTWVVRAAEGCHHCTQLSHHSRAWSIGATPPGWCSPAE